MSVPVHVAWAEYEAAAELERIFAQAALLMSSSPRSLPGCCVIGPQKVQNIRAPEVGCAVAQPVFIDQKGESDSGLVTKQTSVGAISQAYRSQVCAFFLERMLVFAQLRDVLTAEDSPVVAQKNYNGRLPFPKRAEPHLMPVRIRQNDAG